MIGKKTAEPTTADYQRETAEKDEEYDSTASALEGKRELNAEETARLKRLWKRLVRMFHPDLHEHDPEKRKTYELLTQAPGRSRSCTFASRFAGEMNFAVRWRGGRFGDQADRGGAAGGVGDGDRWIERGGGADCGGGAGTGG